MFSSSTLLAAELLFHYLLITVMKCSVKTCFFSYYGILKCTNRNPQLFSLDLARFDKHISRTAIKCFCSLFILQLVTQDCPEVGRATCLVHRQNKPLPQFFNKYLILRLHIFLFQCCLTALMQAL